MTPRQGTLARLPGGRLFTLCSAVSLVLFAAVCALSAPAGDGVPTVELLRVRTGHGHFVVDSTRMGVSAYASGPKGANDFVRKKPLGVRVFDVPRDGQSLRGGTVPHWMLTLPLAALPAWWVWRRRWRKVTPGTCASCGYDLRATPDRCPECGAVPAE